MTMHRSGRRWSGRVVRGALQRLCGSALGTTRPRSLVRGRMNRVDVGDEDEKTDARWLDRQTRRQSRQFGGSAESNNQKQMRAWST